jgi:hypothetical protein
MAAFGSPAMVATTPDAEAARAAAGGAVTPTRADAAAGAAEAWPGAASGPGRSAPPASAFAATPAAAAAAAGAAGSGPGGAGAVSGAVLPVYRRQASNIPSFVPGASRVSSGGGGGSAGPGQLAPEPTLAGMASGAPEAPFGGRSPVPGGSSSLRLAAGPATASPAPLTPTASLPAASPGAGGATRGAREDAWLGTSRVHAAVQAAAVCQAMRAWQPVSHARTCCCRRC